MVKSPLILHPEFREHCDDILFACEFRAYTHQEAGLQATADHERRCAAAIRGLLEILDSWTPPPLRGSRALTHQRKEKKKKEDPLMKPIIPLAAALLLALTLTACGQEDQQEIDQTTPTVQEASSAEEEETFSLGEQSVEDQKSAISQVFAGLGYTPSDLSLETTEREEGSNTYNVRINATFSSSVPKEVWKESSVEIQDLYRVGISAPYMTFLTIVDGEGTVWNAENYNASQKQETTQETPTGDNHSTTKQDDVSQAEEKQPLNTNRHDDILAAWCAEDIVKHFLKAPSTAEVCPMEEMSIRHVGNGEYIVTGWVDAENSYGAMLRSDFIVTYTATRDGYENGYAIIG